MSGRPKKRVRFVTGGKSGEAKPREPFGRGRGGVNRDLSARDLKPS